MARYTKLQLAQAKDEQFSEMVSPVLTLILSVCGAPLLSLQGSLGRLRAGGSGE